VPDIRQLFLINYSHVITDSIVVLFCCLLPLVIIDIVVTVVVFYASFFLPSSFVWSLDCTADKFSPVFFLVLLNLCASHIISIFSPMFPLLSDFECPLLKLEVMCIKCLLIESLAGFELPQQHPSTRT